MGPTFSMNLERKINRWTRTELVQAWRDPVKLIVRQPQYRWRAPGPCGIEVHAVCRGKADRGAYYPAAKCMIDAVTDKPKEGHVGWWLDDSPEWVTWERHWPPTRDMSIPVGLIRVTLEVVVL
jgi:hypothetical protein